MLLLKTVEYLFYLALFIFMCKHVQAASVQPTEPTVVMAETLRQPLKQQEPMRQALEDCETSSFSWMCLKIEFVRIMEHLAEQQELSVLPGVTVVKDVNATELKTSELMAEVARSYPSDPHARLNGYILAKMENILKSRFLRFRLFDDSAAQSDVASGRKHRFGKKGGMEALIAAGVMMKGMLMAMGFGAIALLAGKALMTALMALTLSGVLGLKNLAGGGGKSTTYEIVAKPVYTSSHSHSISHDDGHAHGAHFGAGVGNLGSASGYGGYARALKLNTASQPHTT